MIERVLGWLSGHGVDEVVLSLGYRPDAFLEAYPEGRCAGVGLRYAVEAEPLDTAGAIRFAATEAGLDDTFLVVNGDVLTALDVTALVDFHRHRPAQATIALTPVDDPSAFGVVPTDDEGRVLAFIEKPSPGTAPTNLINAGTYVLEPSVLEHIPAKGRVSIERQTFPALVEEGSVYAMASDADWVDAGTPAAYLAANLRYAGQPDRSCLISERAVVKDSVIGRGTEIGPGALVHSSVLMDQVRIGENAEIRDSVIGESAQVGDNSRVGALTMIGKGFVVSPGSNLSGQRLPHWS
jgi:mannose-1-phosphate guanylyltransferase